MEKERQYSNHLVMVRLLAISDMIFSLFRFLVVLPSTKTFLWTYSKISCVFFVSVTEGGSFVAVGIIVAISLERCYGLTKETQFGLSKTTYIFIGSLIFLIAMVSLTPMIQALGVDDHGMCRELWTRDSSLIYSLFLLTVYCCTPIVLLTFFNLKIAFYLQRNMKEEMRLKILSQIQRVKRHRDKKRALLHLLLLMLCFVVFVHVHVQWNFDLSFALLSGRPPNCL